MTYDAKPVASARPILGVFDSGFGGLTVLRALLPLLPDARFMYLGDTARLPYGAKSQATVARYALSSGAFLLAQGIDLLVVACNTASALALPELIAALPVPVVGVIEPGVAAAQALAAASPPNEVLVLATAATVGSGAYTHACRAKGLRVSEKACPLLVPLVEEGWIDHPVTREVARIYLTEALDAAPGATTLVLGCTHYPLLEPVFRVVLAALGHSLAIVDSARATADAAVALLPLSHNSFHPVAQRRDPLLAPENPQITFYATDSIEKFARLGPHFLGQAINGVHLLDLGG